MQLVLNSDINLEVIRYEERVAAKSVDYGRVEYQVEFSGNFGYTVTFLRDLFVSEALVGAKIVNGDKEVYLPAGVEMTSCYYTMYEDEEELYATFQVPIEAE